MKTDRDSKQPAVAGSLQPDCSVATAADWHKALWREWKMMTEGYPIPSLMYYLKLMSATNFLHGIRGRD